MKVLYKYFIKYKVINFTKWLKFIERVFWTMYILNNKSL
jgi:hypothetical protein